MRPLASDQRSGMTAQIQPPQTLKPLPTPDPEPEPHSQQRPALACEELRLELRLPASPADHAAAGDAPKDTAAGAARRQQLKGTLIVAGGVLWFTPDSTTIKMVDDDEGLNTVFWRCVFYVIVCGVGLFLLAAKRHGCTAAPRAMARNLWDTGWVGFAIACTQGTLEVMFCLAQKATTSANVLVVLAAVPLISALLSRGLLREAIPLRTAVTILVGVAAVSYVFLTDTLLENELSCGPYAAGQACTTEQNLAQCRELLDGGCRVEDLLVMESCPLQFSCATVTANAESDTEAASSGNSSALGLVFAVVCACALAGQLVLVRYGSDGKGKSDDHFLICLPCGAAASLVVLLLLGAEPGAITSSEDFLWLFLGGGVVLPVSANPAASFVYPIGCVWPGRDTQLATTAMSLGAGSRCHSRR